MPVPFLKKIHKKTKISMNKLESKWKLAKEIATKEDKAGNYSYIMGIFKHMIHEKQFTFKKVINE